MSHSKEWEPGIWEQYGMWNARWRIQYGIHLLILSMVAKCPSVARGADLKGSVLDNQKRPAAGATVATVSRFDRPTVTTTDASGNFHLKDVRSGTELPLFVRSKDGLQQSYRQILLSGDGTVESDKKPIELESTVLISGKVVDGAGKPVAKALVDAAGASGYWGHAMTLPDGSFKIPVPANAPVPFVVALKSNEGFDYVTRESLADGTAPLAKTWTQPLTLKLTGAATLKLKLTDHSKSPVQRVAVVPYAMLLPGRTLGANLQFSQCSFAITNENGEAVLDWLPKETAEPIELKVISTQWKLAERTSWTPGSEETREMSLVRRSPLRGRVFNTDGSPAAGVIVRASGEGWDGELVTDESLTDSLGRYEFSLPPDNAYMVGIEHKEFAAQSLGGLWVREGVPREGLDLYATKGSLITGTVTDELSERPAPNITVELIEVGSSFSLKRKEESRLLQENLVRRCRTNADGKYRFLVGPGSYVLRAGVGTETDIELKDQPEFKRDFSLRVIKYQEVTFQVVDAAGRPSVGAEVKGQGLDPNDSFNVNGTTDGQGRLKVRVPLVNAYLSANSSNGKQVAVQMVNAKSMGAAVAIKLQPSAQATGKLLNDEKQPAAEVDLIWAPTVGEGAKARTLAGLGGKVRTDNKGTFQVVGLAVKQPYQLLWSRSDSGENEIQLQELKFDKPGDQKLGEITLPRPAGPPTFTEKLQSVFNQPTPLRERVSLAIKEARREGVRPVLIWGLASERKTKEIFAYLFEDDEVDLLLWDIEAVAANFDNVGELPAELRPKDVKGGADLPLLMVLDESGKKVKEIRGTEISNGLSIDRDKLVKALKDLQIPDPAAADLWKAAVEKASREKKNVLVLETAPRHIESRKLSHWIDRFEPILSPHFVVLRLDNGRTKGVAELLATFSPEEVGVPYLAIVDTQGKLLGSSVAPDGRNYGLPEDEPSIEQFLTMLKNTGSRLTDADLKAMKGALLGDE